MEAEVHLHEFITLASHEVGWTASLFGHPTRGEWAAVTLSTGIEMICKFLEGSNRNRPTLIASLYRLSYLSRPYHPSSLNACLTIFFSWLDSPSGPRPPLRGSSIVLRYTTPDEWSVRRGDLYLTTHNTHQRQTIMCPVRFEPAIPASERQ